MVSKEGLSLYLRLVKSPSTVKRVFAEVLLNLEEETWLGVCFRKKTAKQSLAKSRRRDM